MYVYIYICVHIYIYIYIQIYISQETRLGSQILETLARTSFGDLQIHGFARVAKVGSVLAALAVIAHIEASCCCARARME